MTFNTKNIKADRRARADRAIPYEEMRRLMQTYGSVKCLRKRQSPGGEDTKIESVKRKFYRWFPDLEERFVKDKDGHYQPKLGHEFEVRYREEMRTKDGEILSKKRAKCRKEKFGSGPVKAKRTKTKATSSLLSITKRARVSRTVSLDVAPDEHLSAPSFPHQGTDIVGTDITLTLGTDPISYVVLDDDTEPMDRSFIAEKGIFDDVEESFYGPDKSVPNCPISPVSSCSSSSYEPDSSLGESTSVCSATSWNRAPPAIEDMLNRSMEDCCDEILGSSNDSDSVSDYIFEMISS